MSTKTCSRCKEEKDVDLFIKKRNICKKCSNEGKKKSMANQANTDPNNIVECIRCKEKKKYALFIKGRKHCKECNSKERKERYAKKKANISDTKLKFCSLCSNRKVETEFNPGFAVCKICQSEQKKARHDKLRANLPDSKQCLECDMTQDIDQFRIGENVCYTCAKLKTYKWRKDNPERFQKICERSRQKDDYREKQNKSKKERYHNNPTERVSRNYRCHLRDYIFRGIVSKKIDKIVGISQEKMKDWLEFNFKPGMTWDNYGTFWNLDHVIPCSSYDLEDNDALYECFSWKNTMPVYCKSNLEKFNKVEEGLKGHIETQANIFMDPKLQYNLKLQKEKKQRKEEKKQKRKEEDRQRQLLEEQIESGNNVRTDKIEEYFNNIDDSEDDSDSEEDVKPIKNVKKVKKVKKVKETPKKEKKDKKGKKMKLKSNNFEVIKTVKVN